MFHVAIRRNGRVVGRMGPYRTRAEADADASRLRRMLANPEGAPMSHLDRVAYGVYRSLVARGYPPRTRETVSSAYAIAVRQGQQHGYLMKGTRTATLRGMVRGAAKATDETADRKLAEWADILASVRTGRKASTRRRPGRKQKKAA